VRFRLLLLDASRWTEGCGEPAPAPLVDEPRAAEFAGRALAVRRRALCRRLQGLDWSDPTARHKARIAAKKMRYAAEFFLGLGPKSRSDRYPPFIDALSDMQDGLGRLNDLVVAEAMIPRALDAVDVAQAERVSYAAGMMMGLNLAGVGKLAKSTRRASRAFIDAPVWW
jgi:inorganic triphosphatase YgiF